MSEREDELLDAATKLVDAAVETTFERLNERMEDFFAHAIRCPDCERAGRFMLTTRPQCERCYNMLSPHKAEMQHWDEDGRPVEPQAHDDAG